MKIDETNLAIIKHLREGRKSFQKIAEDLSITENTVRARVNRLTEEGVLDVTGLVDPEAIPGHRLVMVGIKLGTMDLVKKGEEFSRLKGVVSVCVVTGRYDLILTVLLNDDVRSSAILHGTGLEDQGRPVRRDLRGLQDL